MNKNWLIFIVIILILVIAWFAFRVPVDVNPPDGSDELSLEERVRITEPVEGAVVTSPLTITGEAPGNWYFEASFPVEVVDGSGGQLALVPAQAQGEWMTTEQVPFSVTLTFTTPTTDTGTLILHRDNPSGLPENDANVRIPIRFR